MLVTENIKASIDITQIETKRAEIRTSLRRPRDLASTIPARTEDRGQRTQHKQAGDRLVEKKITTAHTTPRGSVLLKTKL